MNTAQNLREFRQQPCLTSQEQDTSAERWRGVEAEKIHRFVLLEQTNNARRRRPGVGPQGHRAQAENTHSGAPQVAYCAVL